MPSIDALRGVLLPNNLAAAITLLITGIQDYWNDDGITVIVLATVLLISLVVTIITLGLIWIGERGRNALRATYSRLDSMNLSQLEEDNNNNSATIRGMSPKLFIVVTMLDFLAVVALLVLVPISFQKSVDGGWRSCAGVVGTIGGLVALVVHGFFLIMGFCTTCTHRYVIRIRLERRPRNSSFAAGARAKEGSSSSSYQSVSPRPGPSGLVTGIVRHSIEAGNGDYSPESDGANAEDAANADPSNTDSTASTQIRVDQAEASESDRLIDDHE